MSDSEFLRIINLYQKTVYSVAYCFVKNTYDADDITQDIFLKLYTYKGSFNDDEHIKAWLIRCTVNECKSLLSSVRRKFTEPLSAAESMVAPSANEEDMMFLNDIVALNNQIHVEQSDIVNNTQNVLSALMSQTKAMDNSNRIDLSDLSSEDVDYIIGLLKMGTADSSNLMNNNDEMHILSEKFFALLKDSIINKKVFRIDFDNQISVIIRIDKEGKISAEFLTNDDALETFLKNNLHVLKERFEELNVSYGDITYKKTDEAN